MLSIIIPNHNENDVDAFVIEVKRICPDAEVIVSNDECGIGKGWALRQGLEEATGDQIAFIDADGDIPPKMLKRLLPFLEDYDIVVGSKRMTNAPLHRKIITHLSRLYLRIVFNVGCDTQTGIKLFRRQALPEWDTNGFMFDLEILAKARKNGCNIIEIPIEAEISASISKGVLWKSLIESIRIRLAL